MNRKLVRLLGLACLLALSAQSVTVMAQVAVKRAEQGAQERTVWVEKQVEGGQAVVHILGPDGMIIQEKQAGPGRQVEMIVEPAGVGAGTFGFVANEMSFDTKLVKGLPFSAVAINESTQTLSDGNRIVRRTSSGIYRDSEGRTRREQVLNSVGPYTAGGNSVQRVFINDPGTGNNYVLDPKTLTAQKFAPNRFGQITMRDVKIDAVIAATAIKVSGGVLQGLAVKKIQPSYPAIAKAAGAEGTVQVQVTIDESGKVTAAEVISGHPLLRDAALDAAKGWAFKPTELSGTAVKAQGTLTFNFTLEKSNLGDGEKQAPPAPAAPAAIALPRTVFAGGVKTESRTESLGIQKIDGIDAEGTRTVNTIPAGALGNERPIDIISERWFSPELQIVVLTRHSDPRTGENVYRLENVNRSEPHADLFRVPSDYSVSEPRPAPLPMMRKVAQ